MTAKLNYMALLLVAFLVAVGTSPLGAALAWSERSESNGQNPDTLQALLVEVKGLRAAMEQLASAGPRVQLLFGRLQLQEQRINAQTRKLEGLRGQILETQKQEARHRSDIQRYETFLAANPSSPERPDLERELPSLRKALEREAAEVLRLQADEATLLSDIATEQARWNDINRALDELDRALTRR